jgi:hypothetical protein
VHTRHCRRYRDGTKIGEELLLDTLPEARSPREHLLAWLHHRGGCSCLSCGYVAEHLDDDDDLRGGVLTDDE